MTGRDDDLAAAGDDLRDGLHWGTLIENDLTVQDPPPADWRPDPSEMC